MAKMHSLPRISSFASVPIWLLLLIPGHTSHAYLPRLRPKQSSTWLAPDIISTRRRQQSAITVDGYGSNRPRLELRGGADASYAHDVPAEDEVATTQSPVANIDVMESSADTPEQSNEDGDGDISRSRNDADEIAYAAIGVLDLTTHSDNIILLSYKCDDDPNRQVNERWGIREVTSVETKLSNGYDANELVLAESYGCLCHGVVINLPLQILESGSDSFGSQGIDSNHFDDILLSVAQGIVRRLKGTQQIEVSLRISFEGTGNNDQLNDLAKENAKQYIEGYLERALYHLWDLNYGKIPGADEFFIVQQCKINVEVSPHTKLEAPFDMAKNALKQNSDDDWRDNNIVPRKLFGTLCNHVHSDIYNDWLSRNGSEKKISAEWERLSVESQYTSTIEDDDGNNASDTTINNDNEEDTVQKRQVQQVSTDLRHKVESMMAMAFAVAEDSLLELETKMDDVFLESDGERNLNSHPVPEFGSDADTIVNTMSASFIALLDENKHITEPERQWVEGQRVEALKQVVGVGIHRLFHLHLQSLRDHFGHWYECKLGGPLTDDFDSENSSSKNKHEWNIQRQNAAMQAEEGFRKAAFGSIPQICQHPEGELCDELAGMYGCVESLRGLLEDMYEVTSTRGLEEDELEAIMGVSPEGADMDIDPLHSSSVSRVGLRQLIKNIKAKIKRRGPAKWYERLALKVLVIGVNYIQGWIVLQALRNEARKRDLEMPKFPLF